MTNVKSRSSALSRGTPLARSFYTRDVVEVAHDLLGAYIVRVVDGQPLMARIVECEAYRSDGDAASHAHRGKTERNRPMFGPPGHAYVYFIYGMHWMFNVVAHLPGEVGAVLIRAAEPVEGTLVMQRLRGGRIQTGAADLTNGPAKLAQALAITGALNDIDLCRGAELTLTAGDRPAATEVMRGPRMRVPGDESAKARPWRFWIHGNAFVSR